jgi:hypothetical protein
MARVELRSVWEDSDGMLQIVVSAASSSTSSSMDVYAYPTDVKRFAGELEGFPRTLADEVVWECGDSDPKWYGHMRLRAHVIDRAGHSALEVFMDVREAVPGRATSHFFVPCNPADLNELGRRIKAWRLNPSERLSVEW